MILKVQEITITLVITIRTFCLTPLIRSMEPNNSGFLNKMASLTLMFKSSLSTNQVLLQSMFSGIRLAMNKKSLLVKGGRLMQAQLR